jgi:hypothetical protein
MPRVAPIQNTFNAGELSPSLEGRTDFDKYKAGCYRVENFIPLVQGPAEYRPGLHFVAQTKSNNLNRSWLVPFHFNQTQSYAIEVGDRYARFFYQRGQLLDSTSAPYEITAPYTANDLINADGTFRPSFAQSNDVLFFAQSGYYPQMLERHGHTDWAFRPFGLPAGSYNGLQVSFQGPMGATNIDKGKKLYASAATGVVTLTALLGAIFEPWMAGRYMMIEDDGLGPDTIPWQSGKVVAANDIRRVGNRHYIAITPGTSGGVQPVHTEGIRADGDAVAWQFLHPGWGVVLINSVIDPSHATATVIMRLPDHVVTAAYATSLFAFEAWNTNDGYPNCVFFFRERLGYARGSQLWLSQPGDFFNFAERDLNNEITAESALSLTIAAATADPIRWARETPHGLLVGTDGGEFLVSEATTSEALSASNVRCTPQSAYGSRPMAPISIQHAILFIQRGGRRLREAVYDIMNESTKSRDLTVLSDHITRSGVTSLAFQQEPRRTMWATRQDGTLLSFTYDVEQDVYGWHRHPLGGNAFAECVCSIPSPDGQSDDLWIITNQMVGAKQYRMVQYLERGYQDGDDVRNAIYLDAAMVYEGAIRNGVNRFDFPMLANWIGQQVYVVADGVPCGWSTVLDLLGQALVQIPGPMFTSGATRIVVGFPYTGVLATMRRDEGAADGTAQGKTKRAHELWVRLRNSLGGKVGPDRDHLEPIRTRTAADGMTASPPPFTGDVRVPYPGDYETDGRIYVVQDLPLPMTVVALMPRMATNE